jgi:hypothetical protein
VTRAAVPSIRDLLDRVHAAGVDLYRRGDAVRYRCPPGALTPELRAEIVARRVEILAYLAAPPWVPCRCCGRFAFSSPSVTCYWCRPAGGVCR